ncbi:MAG: hypothetical protein PIR02_19170 [Microbacterium enclense]
MTLAATGFLAEPSAEQKLIGLAYAFEQQTRHRQAPPLLPDLLSAP